ncbi:MAG: zinc-binding alcohol dehydrogenase family protein [Caldilineaceae bacterium]|nr:zinc-binding alcohol dehydrogenase family protein [Caldilineaceae bacterium]
MKTIVLETPGEFRLIDTPEPSAPGQNEALVRVRRIGICGTDLHAYRGRQPFFSYPRILGHELGVEIVALGDSQQPHTLQVGDICAVEPYLNCGVCSACRRGKTNCCQQLKVLGVHIDGGMREYITVPTHKLHKAQGAPLEHLAVVEMLCIGAHAVHRAQVIPGEQALVIGAGPIGLATMQFAQLAGAEVICLELNQKRIEFCQEHLGVKHFIHSTEAVEAALQRSLGGELPTLVFDATGNAQSMMNAFHYPAHGGKLIYVGLVQGELTFNDPYFHSHELTLLATRNATSADFAYVVDCLNGGKIKLDPWITHHATPAEFIEAFPTWLEPANGVVKAMLDFA